MRRVVVTPYTEEWNSLYEKEKYLLKKIFGSEVIQVYHIGSTSVRGLKAKPIIDILMVVNDIKKVDLFNNEMVVLGYESKGENGIVGRRYFQKGGYNRSHHVHVYEWGNPDIDRHIVFRDYLRTHPDEVNRYGNVKEELSQCFPTDIQSYIDGKEQLVQEIEQKALAWYAKANN